MIRSSAATGADRSGGAASRMITAVRGAIRNRGRTAASAANGATAMTRAAASGNPSQGCATATEAPTTAPPKVPARRSIPAPIVPPTLTCITTSAVITAQTACGSPSPTAIR